MSYEMLDSDSFPTERIFYSTSGMPLTAEQLSTVVAADGVNFLSAEAFVISQRKGEMLGVSYDQVKGSTYYGTAKKEATVEVLVRYRVQEYAPSTARTVLDDVEAELTEAANAAKLAKLKAEIAEAESLLEAKRVEVEKLLH